MSEAKFREELRQSFRHVYGKAGCEFEGLPGGKFKSGLPDIMVMVKDRIMFLELKIDSNEPTALQDEKMRRYHRFGFNACWIRKQTKDTAVLYYILNETDFWRIEIIKRLKIVNYNGESKTCWDVNKIMRFATERKTS